MIDCREEKGEEGRKGSGGVFWMLARIRVTVALKVTQCVSGKVQRGEKHFRFLISKDFSPPAFPLLLEGTKTVPVHLPLTVCTVLMAR